MIKKTTGASTGQDRDAQIKISMLSGTSIQNRDHRPPAQAAASVEHIIKADAKFFARRPDRNHRVRLAGLDEVRFAAAENNAPPIEIPPGFEWCAAIRQVAPGVRLRKFWMCEAGSDCDLSEAQAERIYRIVTADSEARAVEQRLRQALGGAS